MDPSILLNRRGAIAEIALNRPSVHNAFDGFQVRSCEPGQAICGVGEVLLRVLHQPGWIALGSPSGPLELTSSALASIHCRLTNSTMPIERLVSIGVPTPD